MSKQRIRVDGLQDPDHLLYVSLLILGLDPVALEHKLKTPVNQKCFSRINRKLGDAILHFIYVCLDREKAGKIFRDCWPVLDKKRESQFYKSAFEWYKTLQQSYKQPVPTVMTKTFMEPGGPRFTSTLVTLARIALHTWMNKRGPSHTLLNAPTHCRNREQNWQTLRILQAFKVAHAQNYIMQQRIRENVLVTLKNKARELCSNYRRLCKEGEAASLEFNEVLNNNSRLAHHQKELFASASPAAIQKAVLGDISSMNDSISKLWDKVDHFQQVEESAWKVLCPLLDGSTSLTHINGSVYSPQVPEMVYKTHANAINKLKLQGLYHEGKLDLLSLVQYSTLALTSLLDTFHNTHSHTHTESLDKIRAQSGQVTSLEETVNQLTDSLNALLPSINQSFSSSFLSTSGLPTLERIGLGKPQLCPPTPPFTLLNKPVPMSTTHVPLQLTPSVQQPPPKHIKDGFNTTPRRLLCDMGMIYASRKSPKANVMYSAVTHKDDSIKVIENIQEDTSEQGLSLEMLTADLRGHYQQKKEQTLLSSDQRIYQKQRGIGHSLPKRCFTENYVEKQVKTPMKLLAAPMYQDMKEQEKPEETQNMKCSVDAVESPDDTLIDKLVNGIAEELTKCDGFGSKEVLNSWNETGCKDSTLKSVCAGMSKDSDALSDAIQDMNIIKKFEKLDKSKDCPPNIDFQIDFRQADAQFQSRNHKYPLPLGTPKKQNGPLSEHQTQLADVILIPKILEVNNSLERNTSNAPKTLFIGHEKVAEGSPFSDQRPCVTSEERKGSVLRFERRWQDSTPNLQERLHFVTQTPVKGNWSPVGTKIPSRFDGLDVSPQSNCFVPSIPSDISRENRNQGELWYHSKAKLDFLLKLQNSSQKYDTLLSQENPQVTTSKPSFISYVENLRKSQKAISSEEKSKTERNNNQNISCSSNTEYKVPDMYSNGWPTETVSKEYYDNFSRMQSLLDLDEDTIIDVSNSKHVKDWLQQDELFVSAEDASQQFETQRRQSSSLLPEASVFDTLTDSILSGEMDVALLTDKNVSKQIRRESLSSRRQSVANMRRLSLESTKHPLGSPSFLSEDCSGIFDESSDCLLSTSLEDI
uniref:HAUS augmin-like complex subunit 6 N-terminal domain-containing protein n=1 Tax=Scylla olivacea TaxID=85551 RepID=A0A0P4WT65_SCYOL